MGAFGLVQLQCVREGVQYRIRGAGEVPALEADVVVDAHTREQRDLLPAQARNAAVAAVDRQSGLLPGGLTADVFQRALDALLPAGPPTRRAVLAGPGRPAPDAGVDILLVPVHPQTGQTWTPVGPDASAYPVPLPLGVWLWLASPQPYLPVPASGGIPQDVLRDDPLPPRPNYLFRADRGTFQHTLVRIPAVRSPWMRTILESLTQDRSADLF